MIDPSIYPGKPMPTFFCWVRQVPSIIYSVDVAFMPSLHRDFAIYSLYHALNLCP